MRASIGGAVAGGHGRVKPVGMDIVITAMIIAIIGLSVVPFFLLSGAFGAPKRRVEGDVDPTTGPVVPVPTDASGPFPGMKRRDSDADPDADGGDSDGADGADGA